MVEAGQELVFGTSKKPFQCNIWNSCNYPLIIAKLPKWFGERPGKKSGDPDSPDEDEDAGAEAAPVDDYAEEEEEEEEEEVNFIFKTKHLIPIIYSNITLIVPRKR